MNIQDGREDRKGFLQRALDQVADACWRRVRCDRVTLMLADGEGEDATLTMSAWCGELGERESQARVRSGDAVAGRVFATARAQRVSDVSSGSYICMPFALDGRVLGVINVRRRAGEPSFSDRDEAVLDALALYAGKAVQSAQLAYLLQSEFARRALSSDAAADAPLALAHGAAQPAQVARMLAKSFYREMKSAGFGNDQIVGAAGEIIDQLSTSLRKHGQRMERGRA